MRSIQVSLTTLFACLAVSGAVHAEPYYNPANAASPTGVTTGAELYRTIGCPGKSLYDQECDLNRKPAVVVEKVAAPVVPVEAPVPAAAPAPVVAEAPAPVQVEPAAVPVVPVPAEPAAVPVEAPAPLQAQAPAYVHPLVQFCFANKR